jgi:beta-galactosidase
VALVRFEIVDSAGVVVPTAKDLVRIAVAGGTTVTLDNGDLRDLDPYHSDRRHAFNGRGLAILRAGEPGQMRVTATAEGLKSASITLRVARGSVPEVITGLSPQ